MLLAAGQTYVIVSGGIDLSVGFVRGMIAVIAAIVMRDMHAAGYSQAMSIAAGLAVGVALGLLPGLMNGILVAKFRVPPFIATLGMYGVANGIAFGLSDGFPIINLPPRVGAIGNGFLGYFFPGIGFSLFERPPGIPEGEMRNLVGIVPNSIVIAGVMIVIFGFILSRTRFGQYIYAIGGNIDAARRSGIAVDWQLIKTYTVSSFFASLSGLMTVLIFANGVHTQFASSLELFSVAAVVIGGASLYGGKGSIFGSFLGVLVLAVLEVGFLMSGVFPFYRFIAVGSILIGAVVIDQTFPELVYD